MKFLILFSFFPIFAWSFPNCVDDVKSAFAALSTDGKIIPISVEKGVFEPKSYTYRVLNRFGMDNHFQGIQKLSGENNFVITGSDLIRNQGDMILINNGKIVKREVLEKWPYWHPGGIQILGNLLAVPIEEYKQSEIAKIYFFNFDQIDRPLKLPIIIDIPHTKSGAVLFHRLRDKRYLIGSYNMTKIEFYYSKTSDIFDGFESSPRITLDKKKI